MGSSVSVCYNRIFYCYSRELVITVIVRTEFDCIIILVLFIFFGSNNGRLNGLRFFIKLKVQTTIMNVWSIFLKWDEKFLPFEMHASAHLPHASIPAQQTWCQFHQRFLRVFFLWKFVLAAFSSYVLALVKNLYEKCRHIMLMKLTPVVIAPTFYEQLLHGYFGAKKLQNWMYLEKSCSICFSTKNERIKCSWNWLL
jgi:hypothetical protein